MWTDHDGRRTPDHGYTISSPCEPEGSGELIIAIAMRYLVNEWTITIPSIQCSELLLFLSTKTEPFAVN